MLDELDKELERRGHRFCRYADDCHIYVGCQRAGERVMVSVTRFLTHKLRLKVNETKSAVARPEERKFLGFRIANDGSERRIAPSALETFKARVRDLTRRTRGVSLTTVIEELTPYLIGWRSYFAFCQTPRVLTSLEAWTRHRLRAYLWRQWRTGPNRFQELRRPGRPALSGRRCRRFTDGNVAHGRTPCGAAGAENPRLRRSRAPATLRSCQHSIRSNRRGTDPYARWYGRSGTVNCPPIPINGVYS